MLSRGHLAENHSGDSIHGEIAHDWCVVEFGMVLHRIRPLTLDTSIIIFLTLKQTSKR